MKRKDITIGIVASLLAILGLSSSILSGNEDIFIPEIFGRFSIGKQKTLLGWAVMIASLTGLKYWLARRNREL